MFISTNIANLNNSLRDYQTLSGQAAEDVLSKQGGKLGYNIYTALRQIKQNKGSIRSQILSRLASGRMIRIRQSVRDSVAAKRAKPNKKTGKVQKTFKLTYQQELVRREIAVRESGRGVLSVSIFYPRVLQDKQMAISRYGQLFSQIGIKTDTENKFARFTWPGISTQSARVIKGLHGAKAEAAINDAIQTTTSDIMVYVRRKQQELALRMVRKLIKQ